MKEFGSPIFSPKEKDPKPKTRYIPPSPSLSSVPFSWEKQPGIPKSKPRNPNKTTQSDPLLPLPPPLRSAPVIPRGKNRADRDGFGPDPFAVALAECTKSRCVHLAEDSSSRRRRRTAFVGPGSTGVFGSCKGAAACSVSEPAVFVPRSGPYGLLNRRLV